MKYSKNMENTRNGLPLYAEEVVIERTAEEEIADLREKLKFLQIKNKELKEENKQYKKSYLLSSFGKKRVFNRLFKAEGEIYKLEKDLVEEKRHSGKLDDLAWENWETKNKAEKERDDLKTELAKEKEKSNSLQTELEEIKNKPAKRTWKDFYDWLNANIIEKDGSLSKKFWDNNVNYREVNKVDGQNVNIRPDKQDIYPNLSRQVFLFQWFVKLLSVGDTSVYFENRGHFKLSPYREHEEQKLLDELCIFCNFFWDVRSEIQKLLEEWKQTDSWRNIL